MKCKNPKLAGRLTVFLMFLVILPATVLADPGSQVVQPPMLALQRTRWIPIGSRHPVHVLYAFTDPNCPYCHKLWVAMQPYYHRDVQVRHILVGIISASSPGKAAAILDARDPSAALRKNEARWGMRADGGGGIAPLAQPSSTDLKILALDQALMQDFGIPGTPALMYQDKQGKIHVMAGLPDKTELAGIINAARVPTP
ncbi:MAG: thiol:disulfide interchange protein DsbG [Gammaproteobacteria bacterium]|nr:thiol:disulfide interchange protein DsbG [Gammaproteobacteria bacterium]